METKTTTKGKWWSITGAALLALAALAVVAALTGCAAQEEPEPAPVPEPEAVAPEPEPAPEPESEPEPEQPKLAIPNRYFLSSKTISYPDGMSRKCLVDLEGNEVPFEIPDVTPMGGFAEGYLFGSWDTSEYDEEWDTEFDKLTHYGLFDKTGKLAVDLTEVVHGFEYPNDGEMVLARVINEPTYVDGRMVLVVEVNHSGNIVIVVLDERGEVKFTVGSSEIYQYADDGFTAPSFTVECPVLGSSYAFHDGVLQLDGPLDKGVIVDTDGAVLYRGSVVNAISLGKGYLLVHEEDAPRDTKVTDYAGNVVFDAASIEVAGDVENAGFYHQQPGAYGIVVVTAEKINPHGGDNKDLAGLYCVQTQKWLIPMQEGEIEFGSGHDGLIWVSADGKSSITDGYGAADEDSGSRYSCIMDPQGTIVVDGANPLLSSAGISADFKCPVYLREGYYLFAVPGGVSDWQIAYFHDGVIEGVAKYPELGICESPYLT